MRRTFIIIAIALLAGAIFYSINQEIEFNESKVLEVASEEINKIWKFSVDRYSGNWKRFTCTDLVVYSPETSTEYLNCNRDFLECYFQQKADNNFSGIEVGQYTVSVIGKKDDRYKYTGVHSKKIHGGSHSPGYAVTLDLQITNKQGKVISQGHRLYLEDTCHQKLLPQRVYATGQAKNYDSDFLWNNFGQQIYIDQFYADKRDVNEWLITEGKSGKYTNLRDLSSPATDLNPSEMKEYCAFKGKTLLESRVLDAASFRPINKIPTETPIFRGPYPWTDKVEKLHINSPNLIDCEQIFSKDCLKKSSLRHYYPISNSWIDVSNILGGYLEFIENRKNPYKNIKLSSFYFPTNSKFHEIGIRGHWKGEGHEVSQITFDDEVVIEQEKPVEIAFRCMRVEYD